MAEPALRLCADAGLTFETTDRSLLVPCANAPVDLLLVRAHDVPEYVQDRVVDLGITGANLVAEAGVQVQTLAELGFARCTLQAAVPEDAPQAELRELDGLRIATAYPASTRSCLEQLGIDAELVPSRGRSRRRRGSACPTPSSTSSRPARPSAPTGCGCSARCSSRRPCWIADEAALARAEGARERLELMVSGVVAARRRRYLMMNAPRAALDEIAALLPGMGAPSVIDLAEPGQVAVHAAVEADDVWDLLAPLKAAGASSILVLPVERLVA